MVSQQQTQLDGNFVQQHPEFASSIEQIVKIRMSIDAIDAQMVHLLAKRFSCTDQVGVLKAQMHAAPADPQREHRQRKQLRMLAQREGLDEQIVLGYHEWVVSLAKQRHAQVSQQ